MERPGGADLIARPCGPVAVALSGGVDSTAALIALRSAGTEVFGITALLTSASAEAAHRAAEVCQRLGVPHYVVDLRERFERLVVDAFAAEYLRGWTPNPCVGCNRDIKLGLLLQEARALGAAQLATGHYARILPDPAGRLYLWRAADAGKDQSYVLHRLSQEQLAATLLVHGARTKDQVRQLCRAAGLCPAKQESQDVCFLSGQPPESFLRERAPEAFRPGDIVDVSGRRLGEHQGVFAYTVGQRRGIGLGGPGGRRFVVHVDVRRNLLVVGAETDVLARWCEVQDFNLIPPLAPNGPAEAELQCHVAVRYHGNLVPARVEVTAQRAVIRFAEPVRAPAPGQSAVLYQGSQCLGGGTISRTELTERFG